MFLRAHHPRPAPTSLQPPAHYLCPAIASHVLPLPAARPSPRFVALLSTRQCGGFSFSPPASSFNQPVNFDTSSVTNMYGMFYVRSPRVPCPNPSSQVSACAPLAAPLRHVLASAPSGPHLAPHRAHALLTTRQEAVKFNQPLTFDTSSVTDMKRMFSVRSPRVPCHQPPSQVLRACAPLAPAAFPRPSSRA